jgi:16S rRNA (cytidine1402-2'-O)-methyltransferase
LQQLAEEIRTMVFYESPHKLVKTLGQFVEHFGADRRVSVSRELTKLYEETIRGTTSEVLQHFMDNPPKGELVIVVEGKK